MIIGAYYLTEAVPGAAGEGHAFRGVTDAERAYDDGQIELHTLIKVADPDAAPGSESRWRETTFGRLLFEECLPPTFDRITAPVKKGDMGRIVDELANRYPKAVVGNSLDAIKDLCFRFAAKSGLTVSIDDVKTPPEKKQILADHEKQAEKQEDNFRKGIITDGERRQKEVEIWTEATEKVRQSMEALLKSQPFNPIDMMVGSGARGNMMQVRQIAGMRGLVANPRGDMIPRPIKSNFREGLAMLEYFIATPGARKGLVDTALRTADSGYLTRRLVDVAQELIVNEEDCSRDGQPARGLWLDDIVPDTAGRRGYVETRLFGRVLLDDVTTGDGTVVTAGTMVDEDLMVALRDDETVTRVRVRSPLTCQADHGVCAACYGRSLATGQRIELGEAVGVIAAQSIGEPGTQLTMRTFHTGGIASASGDIAGGLPRVVELFEARSPKGKALLARSSGVVRIEEDEGKGRTVKVVSDEGDEDSFSVPLAARLAVTDGDQVAAGDVLVGDAKTPKDPKELLDIKGVRETQQYLVAEVQSVYRDQGVSIHDKHIELIVRQMTKRVLVSESGESEFLPGERVDAKVFQDANRVLREEGKVPAEGRPELMGITKASLATDSWLSAASFQETTRVLTEAAIEGRSDDLLGLKENIIIGKLIPAGTGKMEYRSVRTEAPAYEPMAYYSSDDDLAGVMASRFADDTGAPAEVVPFTGTEE
jgi:DNA-directed RNA polymerase subunit beta'